MSAGKADPSKFTSDISERQLRTSVLSGLLCHFIVVAAAFLLIADPIKPITSFYALLSCITSIWFWLQSLCLGAIVGIISYAIFPCVTVEACAPVGSQRIAYWACAAALSSGVSSVVVSYLLFNTEWIWSSECATLSSLLSLLAAFRFTWTIFSEQRHTLQLKLVTVPWRECVRLQYASNVAWTVAMRRLWPVGLACLISLPVLMILELIAVLYATGSVHAPTLLSYCWPPQIWIAASMCAFTVLVVLELPLNLIHIVKAQLYEFEIPPAMRPVTERDDKLYLTDALNASDELLKHFALIDLHRLALSLPHRRRQLFILSVPGGHGRNWSSACAACLRQVQSALGTLRAANYDMQCAVRRLPHMAAAHASAPNGVNRMGAGGDSIGSAGAERIISPVPSQNGSIIQRFSGIRKVLGPLNTTVDNIDNRVDDKPIKDIGKTPVAGAQMITERRSPSDCAMELIKIGPAVACATEALSLLCVASLTEDQYGVVQKDLPAIMGTLLDLTDGFDQFHRLSCACTLWATCGQRTWGGVLSLRGTANAGLNRLVTAFAPYIKSLSLSEEHNRRLAMIISRL